MIERQIAHYIASGSTQDSAALHGARRCLLDWLAATIAGATHPLGAGLRAALAEHLGHGSARLIPDGTACPVTTAALINGAVSHVMEFDDIYREAIYHPGSPVIAACLAVCHSRGASGGELLQAVIKGYEVSNRIGAACNPAHYRFWHTTATVGSMGAAAGASAALGLNAEQCHHALANVTSIAGGLQQAFRSDAMTKPLHVGRAAENGALTALAAERGVTGADGMLTGEVGFGRAMSNDPDWQTVFDDLGKHFTIAHITHKNHGCCGHIFASIDAAMMLQKTHGFGVDEIKSIRVATYQAALDITSRVHPASASEAQFSTPWCVSAGLLMQGVRLHAFSDHALQREDLHTLADKISMVLDDEIQTQFPARRQSRVRITLVDGQSFEHYAKTRKGDPDDPLTDDELNSKFLELVGPALGESRASDLADSVWNIDKMQDLTKLVDTGPGSASRR